MSSSDDGLSWALFESRPVSGDVELASPAAEMAAALQHCSAYVDAVGREAEEVRESALRALAQQGVLAIELESVLDRYEQPLVDAGLDKVHRHLRILLARVLNALAEGGIDIVRLAGRPYEEVAALAEVDGWLHREGLDGEVVIEEIEPAVRHRDTVVRLGRVVMGAPATSREERQTTSEEGPA